MLLIYNTILDQQFTLDSVTGMLHLILNSKSAIRQYLLNTRLCFADIRKKKMKALISIFSLILVMGSCSPTDTPSEKVTRKITIDVATEIGQDFGEGIATSKKRMRF